MLSIATNFREYPRGVAPADWTRRGDPTAAWPPRGYEIDPSRTSWLPGTAPVGGGRGILTWDPVDSDVDRPAQEALVGFCALGLVGVPLIAYARVSGAAGAENGYALAVDVPGGAIRLYELAAGVATLSTTYSLGFALPAGAKLWARYRANTTSLRARLWLDGSTEPGTWPLAATDGTWTDGSIGIGADQQIFAASEIRFYFVSVATGGATAPGPDSIPAGLGTWSLDAGTDVELTGELQYLNPDTGRTASLFVSTHGRRTGAADLPPNQEMAPLLSDTGSPGEVTAELTADALFAGAEGGSLGGAVLRNPRAMLAPLLAQTAGGRSWIVRAGLRSWSQHRWFDIVYSSTVHGEPSHEDNGTVALTLQSPERQLTQSLHVRRYVGIQTGIKLTNTTATNSYLPAYDLLTFAAAGRWLFPAVPLVDASLAYRATSISAEHFNLYLEAGTGCVVARASVAGVNSAILLRSPLGYADGAVHWALFGVISLQLAFLVVDGLLVAQMTPPGPADLPAAGLTVGAGVAGGTLFDLRLYGYCPDPNGEAQSVMAARSDGTEPSIAFLARCDDGLGASLTDTSPHAHSVALAGTVGVNYDWVPTDMGEVDFAGKVMPLVVGAVVNAPAERIDSILERYRMTDGLSHGALLRQRGAATATVGQSTGFVNGVYEFGSATSLPVTFDHAGDPSFAEGLDFALAGPVIEQLMLRQMKLTEADYDPQALDVIRNIAPFPIGALFQNEVAGGAALASLLSWGGHYRLDRDGRIVVDFLRPTVTPGPYPLQPAAEFAGNRWAGVTFPSLASLPVGTPFTVCFWVKSYSRPWAGTTTAAPYPAGFPLVTRADSSSGFWCGLSSNVQGQLVFATLPHTDSFGNVYALSPAGAAKWGTWTFVAMVMSNVAGHPFNVRTIFYAPKGALLSSSALDLVSIGIFTPPAAALPLEIAGKVSSGACLAGSVQHVQIWSSALTAPQLQALMLTPPVGTEPGLVFYAPLTEGRGPVVRDVVSGSTGTIRGARWAPRVIYDFRRSMELSTLKARPNRPAWDVLVPWGKNWSPLTDADIAASPTPVSWSDRSALKRSVPRRASSPDATMQADFLDARQLDLSGNGKGDSVLLQQGDAAAVSAMMRYRLHPKRVAAQLIGAPRSSAGLICGDEIWVFHPSFPWDSQGAAFRVVGFAPMSYATLRGTLDLWGDRLEGAGQALLADGGAPILTDAGQKIVTG